MKYSGALFSVIFLNRFRRFAIQILSIGLHQSFLLSSNDLVLKSLFKIILVHLFWSLNKMSSWLVLQFPHTVAQYASNGFILALKSNILYLKWRKSLILLKAAIRFKSFFLISSTCFDHAMFESIWIPKSFSFSHFWRFLLFSSNVSEQSSQRDNFWCVPISIYFILSWWATMPWSLVQSSVLLRSCWSFTWMFSRLGPLAYSVALLANRPFSLSQDNGRSLINKRKRVDPSTTEP